MSKDEYGSEEELYTAYFRKMNEIEEKREYAESQLRKFDEEQEIYNDIYRELHYFFRETAEHCQEDAFISYLEEHEDEFHDCRTKVDHELEEKCESLERELRDTYEKEEQLRAFMRNEKYKLENK